MDTMNTHALLSRKTFHTPAGVRYEIDASGIETRILVTQGETSHRFVLDRVELGGDDPRLVTKTGQAINVKPSDVQEVGALIAMNAPRQRQAKLARAFFIGALAFVVVIVIAINVPSDNSIPASVAPTQAQPTTAETTTTPGIGTQVTIGKAGLVITKVLERQAVGVHNEYLKETASEGGVLVVIEYKVTNNSDKPMTAGSVPELKLADPSGTTYNKEFGKTTAYASEVDIDRKAFSDINPDITVNDAVVFEVSKTKFDPSTWYAVTEDGQKIRLVSAN